jgi:DNA ligase (NAD+)
VATVLAQQHETLHDLLDSSEEELEEVREIDRQVPHSVVTFFEGGQNREVVERIQDAGLTLSNPLYSAEEEEHPLEGLTFVFTGALDRWKRDEVQRYAERLGWRASSSVSGETDYVVASSGAGSKLDQARQRGVPVMDEEAFVEFVEGRQ